MLIRITAEGVAVEDIEVLDRLSAVVAPGVEAGDALRSAGAGDLVDDDHIRVHTAFVRAAAVDAAVGEEWDARFSSMLAYAATKGWVHEQPEGLIAHIER